MGKHQFHKVSGACLFHRFWLGWGAWAWERLKGRGSHTPKQETPMLSIMQRGWMEDLKDAATLWALQWRQPIRGRADISRLSYSHSVTRSNTSVSPTIDCLQSISQRHVCLFVETRRALSQRTNLVYGSNNDSKITSSKSTDRRNRCQDKWDGLWRTGCLQTNGGEW